MRLTPLPEALTGANLADLQMRLARDQTRVSTAAEQDTTWFGK